MPAVFTTIESFLGVESCAGEVELVYKGFCKYKNVSKKELGGGRVR